MSFLISKVASTFFLTASTLLNPITPQLLPFNASAYITTNNQVRISIEKSSSIPVTILLRNTNRQVFYEQCVGKKSATYAVKLNVNELPDGEYELELKSKQGSIHKQLSMGSSAVQRAKRIITLE